MFETPTTERRHQTFLRRYGLLPHDARILATAIEYGCERLATLDEDFKVVEDVVEIVPGNG
ncbi:PIN domain-containing protein [Thermococcus sp.]|uniref:PIN domain-containing protein n=1 Tax=Thermococcus sp. TaxID=35749 RepID=UPI0026063BE5|nr:PIN domain-containing protein [Thermococcus sp.]